MNLADDALVDTMSDANDNILLLELVLHPTSGSAVSKIHVTSSLVSCDLNSLIYICKFGASMYIGSSVYVFSHSGVC